MPHINYMDANNITPTHTATIVDEATGTTEVVNLYTIPTGLTAVEFGAFFDALVAKAVA